MVNGYLRTEIFRKVGFRTETCAQLLGNRILSIICLSTSLSTSFTHQFAHHVIFFFIKMKCTICSKPCKSNAGLAWHMSIHRKTPRSQSEEQEDEEQPHSHGEDNQPQSIQQEGQAQSNEDRLRTMIMEMSQRITQLEREREETRVHPVAEQPEISDESDRDIFSDDEDVAETTEQITYIPFKNTKNNEALGSSNGFIYRKYRNNWRCNHRSCTAKVFNLDGDFVFKGEHKDLPDFSAVKKAIAKSELRERVKSDIGQSVPEHLNSIKERLGREDQEAAATLGDIQSVKKSLYKIRNANFPKVPNAIEDFKTAYEDGKSDPSSNIRPYLLTADGGLFLRVFSVLASGAFVFFASDNDLLRLGSSSRWFIDGTFKFIPKMFYQVLTVHAMKSEICVPCAYILMTGKKKSLYIKAFNTLRQEIVKVREGNGLPEPIFNQTITADFETGLIPAIQRVFPLSTFVGCLFHFRQAVIRWIRKNGFITAYVLQGDFRTACRRLLAIPLMPLESVNYCYQGIVNALPIRCFNKYKTFFHYFRDFWLPKAALFNCSNEPIKTNNFVEGWNNRMNRLAKSIHLNIWAFIALIKNEQSLTQAKNATAAAGKRRSYKYEAAQAGLNNILRDNDLNLLEKLDNLSINIHTLGERNPPELPDVDYVSDNSDYE